MVLQTARCIILDHINNRCKMKKITISWNILQNRKYQTVYVEVCKDDFVGITRAKLLDKAYLDGIRIPPDSIVVEDFEMGVVNCMRGGV